MKGIYFLTVPEAARSRLEGGCGWALVRTLFLAYRQRPSCCVLTWRRERGTASSVQRMAILVFARPTDLGPTYVCLPLTGCVTLGMQLNLSEPQFPSVKWGVRTAVTESNAGAGSGPLSIHGYFQAQSFHLGP